MKRKITAATLFSTLSLGGYAVSQEPTHFIQPRYAFELPAHGLVKREKPSWGKEVDGLQMGIRLDLLNRPYPRGEVASYTFVVRNVGKKPIKLTTTKPNLWINPVVVDEKGKQQWTSFPAYSIQVHPVTATIAPDQEIEFARVDLRIGSPVKDERNPALDVPPGKYRVSYQYRFCEDWEESKPAPLKTWVGTLSSGEAILEVAPSETDPLVK